MLSRAVKVTFLPLVLQDSLLVKTQYVLSCLTFLCSLLIKFEHRFSLPTLPGSVMTVTYVSWLSCNVSTRSQILATSLSSAIVVLWSYSTDLIALLVQAYIVINTCINIIHMLLHLKIHYCTLIKFLSMSYSISGVHLPEDKILYSFQR